MKIGVIGAGVSGLSTAHFLRQILQKNRRKGEITVFEKSKRVGGAVWTNHSSLYAKEHSKRFLFEWGPRGVRPTGSKGHETLSLVHNLGIDSQVVFSDSAASKRFLLIDGKLEPMPSGILSAFTSAATRPYLKDIAKEWTKPKRQNIKHKQNDNEKEEDDNDNDNDDDESVYDFFTRRFSEEMAFTLATPLVTGIYSGDARSLSIRSCFPSLYEMEQQYGSITSGIARQLLGLSSGKQSSKIPDVSFPDLDPPQVPKTLLHDAKGKALMSFRNGMETLTDALVENLQSKDYETNLSSSSHVPVSVFTDNGVAAVTVNMDGLVSVTTEAGETHVFDHVVSAVSAPVLSTLLGEGRTVSNILSSAPTIRTSIDNLVKTLDSIEMGSIAVANFGISGTNIIPSSKRGFGYLIPGFHSNNINNINNNNNNIITNENIIHDSDDIVLGAIMDSCTFPAQNRHPEETRITVMMRGGGSNFDKQSALKKASAAVTRHLNLHSEDPLFLLERADYADVEHISSAIAQYNVGHHSKIKKIEENLQRHISQQQKDGGGLGNALSVVGSSFHGVGVNDCIADARRIAHRVLLS